MQELPGIPHALVVAWVVALGAAVGSFVNVVVARVPAGLSVVRPRSRCPRCLAPIAGTDNVPVLSWIVLRGRCRACGLPISIRYPLVELAGGAAAWLAFARHGLSGAALAELGLVATLLALALIDLDTWLLPHGLTWPLLFSGLGLAWLGLVPAGSFGDALWGAGVGFAAFAALAVLGRLVFKREALGSGDVWLLAGLGAWLGLRAILPVVLLASLQGTVVGVALALAGRLPKGEEAAGDEPPPYRGEEGPAAATPTSNPTASVPPHPQGPPGSQFPSPPEGERGDASSANPVGEGASTSTETSDPTSTDPPTTGGTPDADEPWTPPRNAVPFGPFLVAGALEWLYLSGRMAALIPTLELFR